MYRDFTHGAEAIREIRYSVPHRLPANAWSLWRALGEALIRIGIRLIDQPIGAVRPGRLTT